MKPALPVLNLNDTSAIAAYIILWMKSPLTR
jgi:hypothetical protein